MVVEGGQELGDQEGQLARGTSVGQADITHLDELDAFQGVIRVVGGVATAGGSRGGGQVALGHQRRRFQY